MRSFVVVVCIALATARPEAGYRYSSPLLPISGNGGHGFSAGPCCQQLSQIKSGLHGGGGIVSGHGSSGFGHGLSAVVSSSYAATGGGGGGGYIGGHGPSQAPLLATPTPVTFTAPVIGGGYSHGSSGFSGFSSHGSASGYVNGAGIGGPIGGPSGGFIGGPTGGPIGGSFNGGSFGHGAQSFGPSVTGPGFGGFSGGNFGGSSIETSASIGGASIPDNSGSTLVQKHIYVHVPPPDPEEHIHTTKIHSQFVQPRKHYKIIFIKAPTVQAPSAAQIAAANALTEEKTLVYVLVKKPEEPSVEQLQAIQSTVHHHKPEVYFIKYKAKTQPQVQGVGDGIGLVENFGGIAQTSGGGFASGSGVTLTSNIGGDHNIPIPSPSPTPYPPAGLPLIEPRAPEKIVPADSYGPPPDAV